MTCLLLLKQKKELTQVEADDHCMKAEVSALIRMNGSLSFANKQLSLDVQTENAAIARRLYTIMKKNYILIMLSFLSGRKCA